MLPTNRYLKPPTQAAETAEATASSHTHSNYRGRGRGGAGAGAGGRGGNRGGAGRGRGSGGRGGHAHAKSGAQKREQKPQEPAEKYVVIIRNVENDLAKIHKASLPFYCCLDPAADVLAPHTKASAGDDAHSGCTYSLTCRSETRSGELCVYGPADADVETVFVPAAAAKQSSAAPAVDDSDERDATQAEIVEDTKGGRIGAASSSLTSSARTHAFSSLQDMVAVLSTRPYFTHPPQFRLTMAGTEPGSALHSDVLDRLINRMRKREARETGEGDADEDGEEREDGRANHNDSDKAHDASDDESDDDDNGKAARKAARTEGSGGAVKPVKEGKRGTTTAAMVAVTSHALKQFGGRQEDLVTAVAVITAASHWSDKDVRRQLADLPGFINCWKLQKKRYRVVFENDTTLFKAKQLLDQFELDGHVRVTVQLSDALGRRYADFLSANEEINTTDLGLALRDE